MNPIPAPSAPSRRFRSLAAAIPLSCMLALAACASPGRERMRDDLAERANPSAVIATEFAFARAAREDGQWTAFRDFAADDALFFWPTGAIEAEPWLKTQDDPRLAMEWRPHKVWSSCDGSVSVTTGGYAEPGGAVGRFYTVWERQRDGTHEWVFDFGYPMDAAPEEPEIIETDVARCGTPVDPVMAESAGLDTRRSDDGTLAWGFAVQGEAPTQLFRVWLSDEQGMTVVVDAEAPPAG